MPIALFVLLLGAILPSAAGERYPGAHGIALFDFGTSTEGEFNKPSGWIRLETTDYPFYVEASLTDQVSATAGRSLRFRLNGGNCAYFSPTVAASDDFTYVVRGQIKTDGLKRDRAVILLEFLDGDGKSLGEPALSSAVRSTTDWQMVQIGPIAPPNPAARLLRVACLTRAGQPADLSGAVYFDDIWIGRLPRFEVETSGAYCLFELDKPKRVTVRVRGFEGRQLETRFFLFDESRKPLADQSLALTADNDKAAVEWELPLDTVGFHQLDVALFESGRELLRRRIPITVMRPIDPPAQGDLGLSLPAPRFGLGHYERLLSFSATRWVRMPFWSSDRSMPAADDRRFAEFLDRIARRGHEVVGRLDDPPEAILDQLSDNTTHLADVFSAPKAVWRPSLEATLVRFGLKVTHWQIGGDRDFSFRGLSEISGCLGTVRDEAVRVGRNVRLGVAWDWFTPPPPPGVVDFLSVGDGLPEPGGSTADSNEVTPLSADDLEFQIRSMREPLNGGNHSLSARDASSHSAEGTRIWTNLSPLSDDRYDRRVRVIDLARRVVATKVAGSDAVFHVDVLDPHRGLIGPDGAPTELFTIWRTLAEHLGGKAYIGRLPVQGPGVNHLFASDGKAALIAWSDEPTTMEAVLGRQAQVIDLWGRVVQGPSENETRQVPLCDLPVLIRDADEFLVRFQLALKFDRGSVSSRFGVHDDKLIVQNPGAVNIAGTATAEFPRAWNSRPDRFVLQITPRETAAAAFAVTMPQGVSQGEYPIPIDFQLAGEKSYRFRVYRPFRVGGDELKVLVTTQPGPGGDLEVEAVVTNLTKAPMSLTGTARTLGRKAEIDFISNLAPGASTTSRYVFRNGGELAGKRVQVKFEDIGGRREFTYDATIKP